VRIRFIVLNAYAKGGTTRTTLDTASRLAARHDVEVVSLNRRRDATTYPLDPRVRLRHLVDVRAVGSRSSRPTVPGRALRWARLLARIPSILEPLGGNRDPRLSLLSDFRLAREIRGMRDGILIGTRPSINLAIAWLARRSVYAVGQEHQYLHLWRPALQRAVARAYPRFDAVTALTRMDVASYRQVLPDGVLVCHLPNAVPAVGAARSPLSSTVVVAAGRLAQQKGFDLLIEAFGLVAERHPDWSLQIYGGGPARDRLAQQIEQSGLGPTIMLKGFSRTLPASLAGASIFALSSRFEGFSLALVEAMGVGLPPVAFACPCGPVEILTDGVDGLLVPPGDIEALAKGICSLIEDPQRRAELGAAARRRVAAYAVEAIDLRWEHFLDQLLARPPGQRRRARRSVRSHEKRINCLPSSTDHRPTR
jgi:glycosyltransferase involved in cell wall biosynthesis